MNQLYGPGVAHARALIKAGKVADGPWGFSGADGNAILGDPPDWTAYASWHLGHDTAATPKTKDAWKYPVGKGGQVYRAALIAIEGRGTQEGDTAIAAAATTLRAEVDKATGDVHHTERRRGAQGGGDAMDELKKALGLAPTATLAETRTAIDRFLADGMSPADKKAAADAQAAADADEAAETEKEKAKEQAAGMMAETLATLRKTFGLAETATPEDIVKAAGTVKGLVDTKLAEAGEQGKQLAGLQIEMKKLTDVVAELKPKAEMAEKLQKEAAATTKLTFFEAVLREGKLLPVERPWWESQWDLAEIKVREYFKDKKAVVKLGEHGTPLPGDVPLEDTDPRVALTAAAQKIMADKKLDFMAALGEAKAAHPELVEQIAGRVGANSPR